jgi:hypothetical protein
VVLVQDDHVVEKLAARKQQGRDPPPGLVRVSTPATLLALGLVGLAATRRRAN